MNRFPYSGGDNTQPPRCSLCGEPNPAHDENYTECCNEPVIDAGSTGRGYDYEEAKRRFEASK